MRYEYYEPTATKQEVIEGMRLFEYELMEEIEAGKIIDFDCLSQVCERALVEVEEQTIDGLNSISRDAIDYIYESLSAELCKGETINKDSWNSFTEDFCNDIDEIFDYLYKNFFYPSNF